LRRADDGQSRAEAGLTRLPIGGERREWEVIVETVGQQVKRGWGLIHFHKTVFEEDVLFRHPHPIGGDRHDAVLALGARVVQTGLDEMRAVAFPLALAHHPQAMDEQVAGRVDGPPGVLAGNVFDKGHGPPADFVDHV